ncbi:uncharacterized protein LOC122027292 [Zingiber officinale]|uniref:uncharacterized protein LOC122027292 n=1 Tax=Zingiber officinale TaxID=94328 RepID=UPI001C4AE337|nr:uncharacterized protein LOC122027292 [Zingiber officinale]
MGCIYSMPLTKSESYSKETTQRIKWSSNLPEELNSKGGGEKRSAVLSSASFASRMITPEGPEKNSTIVPEEFVTRSSCANDVEVINAWELWDGLEEEEKEEHHQELREEKSTDAQTKDDEVEKVDYKFVVISKNLEVEIATPTKDESLTRNKSMENVGQMKDDEIKQALQSYETSIASMEKRDKEDGLKDETGAEQEATLKEVGVVKEESDKEDELKDEAGAEQEATLKGVGVVKAEFTKNTSLKDWLRQGSKGKHPRFSIASRFGSFAFPELGFVNERDEEPVFDPQMLAQFEQAMDQLNTDEEFLLEEIIKRLGQNQEKEMIKSTE